jgi:hypothetical protein
MYRESVHGIHRDYCGFAASTERPGNASFATGR